MIGNDNSWIDTRLKLPYKTYRHGAVILNDAFHVFGGQDLTDNAVNMHYKLNKKLTWERLADMNHPLAMGANSCAVFDGCIWVFGGSNGKDIHKSIEKYDPITNSWTILG